MQNPGYLGIHIAWDRATVVCLGTQGDQQTLAECFSVSVEQDQEEKLSTLATLIAQGCAERDIRFSEASVALDCAMFMQHKVRSAFGDLRKIGQTIRFDTEEALATDVTDMAIAFRIDSSDESGSGLTVFTAPKGTLADVLTSLQSAGIDPVSVEPDVNCLARYMGQNVPLNVEQRCFLGVLSQRNGYLMVPLASSSQQGSNTPAMVTRTLLLSPAVDRHQLIAREVPVTLAQLAPTESIGRLEVFDSADAIDCTKLGSELGLQTEPLDLTGAIATVLGTPDGERDQLNACADAVEFALAYGAALSPLDKPTNINFRSDYMPYQGRKVRLQKALKFCSAAVVVLLLAVGIHGFMQVLQTNKDRSLLRGKFTEDYSAVMFGQDLPGKTSDAVKRLGTTLRRTRDLQKGQLSVTGEESVPAKLTLVLDAFNKCASQVDLRIDTITITAETLSIAGNTSSRQNTLKLFESLRETNLDTTGGERLDQEGGRDTFRVTLKPKG